MAKLSKLLGVHTSKTGSSHIPHDLPKEFPTGLRVLVVDDDNCTLKILKLMLMKCKYNVTDCFQAATALSILRENKGGFDVILTDVHMPGMNGFELLQLLGPEMDLPIIMMSADNRPNVVMTGIQHGASDYLIKPLRMGELRNIWQHVVRKKQQVNDKYQHNTLMNGGLDTCKSQRKKRDTNKNDVVDLDAASSKKRVVWSGELHQRFVNAVNQLGMDKASPTKIRELMNVPGLTRENVSSHWQKYRIHVKRVAKVAQELGVIPSTLFDLQPNIQAGFLSRPNFSALTVFDNVPPQNHASLYPELFGQSSGSFAVTGMHQTVLQQSSVQVPNYSSVEYGIQFTQPKTNLQTNIATESVATFLSGNPSNNLGAVRSIATLGGVGSYQNRSMLAEVVEQGSPLPLSNFSNALSTRSCSVFPSEASSNQNFIFMNQNSTAPLSHSMDNFHGGNMNQKNMIVSFKSQPIIQAENDQFLSHSNNVPSNMGQHYDEGFTDIEDEGFTNIKVLNSCSFPGSTNLSVLPCTYDNTNQLIQTPDFHVGQTNLFNIQDFGFPIENSLNQGQWNNLGSLGNDTFMPTNDVVDHFQSTIDCMSKRNNCTSDDGNAEEFYSDFLELSASQNIHNFPKGCLGF